MKNRTTIEGRDRAFAACILGPQSLPAPAVVLVAELVRTDYMSFL